MPRTTVVSLKCQACGETFRTTDPAKKYCASECRWSVKRSQSKSCAQCGEGFTATGTPASVSQQRFCGEKCAQAAYRAKNREKLRQVQRSLYESDPIKMRRYKQANAHNTTPAFLAELELKQGGNCAICERSPYESGNTDDVTRMLCVDHDHACCPGAYSCGKCIRGLLCGPCNRAIGMLDDNPERLRAALHYLSEAA